MVPPLFERDPDARTVATTIRAVELDGKGTSFAWLEFDDTLFYPEGGGQPSDRGSVDGLPVVDVQRRDGRALHRIEAAPGAFEVGQSVVLELDAERRFDHSQQHTAQHLLSAIAQDHFGWATFPQHSINLWRVLGVVMLFCGVLLIRFN